MAERVTSPELRFRFIEKDVSEVGDYTAFPMEVTGATIKAKFDKMAEIFYRARLAQITSNGLTLTGVTFGVTAGAIDPLVMFSSGGGLSDNYLRTGYHTLDEAGSEVYAAALPFLGEQYDEYYYDPGGIGIGTFRDTNGRESGLLLPTIPGSTPRWNNPAAFVDGGLTVNAFSWASKSAAGTLTQPTIPIPWVSQFIDPDDVYESFDLAVAVTGRIAVVYGGEVGELYHPDNQFFLEMIVQGDAATVQFNAGPIETGYSSTSAIYTIRLATGDLSCPLNATDATLSGELVHEAVEWFPSAKNSPSAPVWNTSTGEKL